MDMNKRLLWWFNADDSASLWLSHKVSYFQDKPNKKFGSTLKSFVEAAKKSSPDLPDNLHDVDWTQLAEKIMGASHKLKHKGEMDIERGE